MPPLERLVDAFPLHDTLAVPWQQRPHDRSERIVWSVDVNRLFKDAREVAVARAKERCTKLAEVPIICDAKPSRDTSM